MAQDPTRLQQVIEAQLGNMVMQIARLTVALDQMTAERDAALAPNAPTRKQT